IEVLDRRAGELRTAVPGPGKRIDTRAPCADERELGGHEEAVRSDEQQCKRKAQQHAAGAERLYGVLLTHAVQCVCPAPSLEEDRFPLRAVDFLERMPDLVERAVRTHAVEHRLDHVLIGARGGLQPLEGLANLLRIPSGAQLGEPLALAAL